MDNEYYSETRKRVLEDVIDGYKKELLRLQQREAEVLNLIWLYKQEINEIDGKLKETQNVSPTS